MKRYDPLLIPALVAPVLAAAIALTACTIILVRPAGGQECRFSFQCVASASAASKPAGHRLSVPARRVHRAAPIVRAAAPDDGMPLVWPVIEPDDALPEPLIPSVVRTVGIVPAVFIPAQPHVAVAKPEPASWLHSQRGKSSILSVFLAFILASIIGIVIAEHQKRHPHERRTAQAFG